MHKVCTWAKVIREIKFRGRKEHNLREITIAGLVKIHAFSQNFVAFTEKIVQSECWFQIISRKLEARH